jgi:hypothetical protein
MRCLVRLAFILLAAPAVAFAADTPAAPPNGQRVFCAGHSFHMPVVQPLEQIAKSAGVVGHVVAGRQMLGGSTVTMHWDLPDDKDQARKALKLGTVDVLTLSPHVLVPDPAIDKFTALLLENNPNGRVTLQVSWLPNSADIAKKLGYRDDDRNKTLPDDLRKAAKPWEEKIREQAKALNDQHAAKVKRQVVFVVPVGEAVYRLRERVTKGQAPGIENQAALFKDGLGHGQPPIGVLTAYCHFAVIYGQSPVGLPAPDALKAVNLGDNLEKVNRVLQECAWEAVTAEPMSGVKPR